MKFSEAQLMKTMELNEENYSKEMRSMHTKLLDIEEKHAEELNTMEADHKKEMSSIQKNHNKVIKDMEVNFSLEQVTSYGNYSA